MMSRLRQALCNHLETTRVFALKVMEVDSGIYDVSQLRTILHEPDTVIQLETTWIADLLEALQIIQRYMTEVERWANHIYGLEHHLRIKETDDVRIQRREVTAVDLLAAKTFEKGYLQWVLADLAEELDRLTAAYREMQAQVPRLVELTQRYGGPYLDQVQQVALTWVASGRIDFPKDLVSIIEAAYAETTAKGILRHLGQYLDAMAAVVTSAPVFPGTTAFTPYNPRVWTSHHDTVTRLLRHTEELKEFVWHRSQAWLLLGRHQEALLQAILPSDDAVGQWLLTQFTEPDKAVGDTLPVSIPTDTLPLALEQAEDLLAEWNTAVETGLPHLQNALHLNEILDSPAVTKFLNADQERLTLYNEWGLKITATFETLRQTAKQPER
jgi:hypothetical protein